MTSEKGTFISFLRGFFCHKIVKLDHKNKNIQFHEVLWYKINQIKMAFTM